MKNFEQWRDDLVAGLTGAVAGAPQAMGFALIAGINPIYGLYTAIVSTILGAVFGRSSLMTIGPTNALALVVATTLAGFEGADEIERLFVLTMLTGVFYLCFGFLRLDFILRFVSHAVMTGFITGAGLLIILGQVRHINGYNPVGDTTLLAFFDWLVNLHRGDVATTVMGITALGIILAIRRTRLKNAGTLIAIIITSMIVGLLHWESVTLVRDISNIVPGLPMPIVPNPGLIPELAIAALAIAILGTIQSASLIGVAPESDEEEEPSDFNRDLIGMGVANVVGGIFQGMPASGSLSRTVINIGAGARTRYANIFAGIFVMMMLVLLGGVIELITLTALAAQLILAATSLINLSRIRTIWRVNLSAKLAMGTTFISTLVLPLEYSIYVGVVLSIGLYLYTSSQDLSVEQLIPLADAHYRVAPVPTTFPHNETIIFSIHGSLYFAAIQRLQAILPDPKTAHHTTVILRLRDASHVGSTALDFFLSYHFALRQHESRLIFTGISPQIHDIFDHTGFSKIVGADNLFDAHEVILMGTTHALDYSNGVLLPHQVRHWGDTYRGDALGG